MVEVAAVSRQWTFRIGGLTMNTVVCRIFGMSLLMAAAAPAFAQECCSTPSQTYRIEYKTECEQRQVTAYRIEYETVCEERQVTSYKPVWETAVRENRYTVARPVTETSVREEYYTVQRPVYETAEREETYTVMKPVYETAYRTEYRTVYQPVTTCQTQYVDQGCFGDQVVLKPGWPTTRLTWQSAACAVDPVTGQTVYQRPGLYWTQTPGGRYEVQKVWHPNVVAQQVQQTSYVPQTVAQQVPMQVCKYMPEQVVRKVPVQVCRMMTEQQVRKIPVTTCRMVYEERVEPVSYQVCRMVAQQQTIRVPHTVEKRIPVTYTYSVPRVVCYRVPLDACGNPIVGYSGETAAPTKPQEPTPAKKPGNADVKPELGSDAAAPRPIDAEEKPPVKEGPMKTVPPMNTPAPEKGSVYGGKST
jgi:YTV